jgi:transcriptional regulator with XRE-family HTH domain
MTETTFKRWRSQMGYSQSQAAKALGISLSYVKDLDAGHSRTTGKPVNPRPDLRKLMTAVVETGRIFEPWPE